MTDLAIEFARMALGFKEPVRNAGYPGLIHDAVRMGGNFDPNDLNQVWRAAIEWIRESRLQIGLTMVFFARECGCHVKDISVNATPLGTYAHEDPCQAIMQAVVDAAGRMG